MHSIRRMMTWARSMACVVGTTGFMLIGTPSSAAPILGAQLFWQGGDVTVTVQASTAGITSELYLYSADPDIFVSYNSNLTAPGTVITLTAAQIDVDHNIGDELVFGIFSPGQGTFLLGPGSRNPDGLIHGAIDDLGGGVLRVGFEDLAGGGDLDYDDNVFDFRGGIATTPDGTVPEPSLLMLLGLGLAGLGFSRRR